VRIFLTGIKKLAGQFEHRSVLDDIASLDDTVVRGTAADPCCRS
jgi:hypothetical protein